MKGREVRLIHTREDLNDFIVQTTTSSVICDELLVLHQFFIVVHRTTVEAAFNNLLAKRT